ERLLHALTHFGRDAEEALEQRVSEHRISLLLHNRANVDVHDGRNDAANHRREGKLHLPHRLRHSRWHSLHNKLRRDIEKLSGGWMRRWLSRRGERDQNAGDYRRGDQADDKSSDSKQTDHFRVL